MGLQQQPVSHHAPLWKHRVKRQSDSSSSSSACTSLYQKPAAGDTVTAYEKYDITWDCNCLGTGVSNIDITLYYYGGGALHKWTNVPCASNSLDTEFNPTWWNSSLSASLQLQITESNQPIWATTTGLGPQFAAQWNGTVPASLTGSARNGTSSGVSVESVTDNNTPGGVSGGKLAAAVAVPLAAAAIAVAAYIFYSRRKGKTQRKRWSAYIDNRMSQYSAAGFDPSNPPFEDAQGRPMSMVARPMSAYTVGTANNFAGVGSNVLYAPGRTPSHQHTPSTATSDVAGRQGRPVSSFYALDGHSVMDPFSNGAVPDHEGGMPSAQAQVDQMRQIGHGNHSSERVSRVSFADTSFGSGKEKRGSYFGFAHSTGPDGKPRMSVVDSTQDRDSSVGMPTPPIPAASQYPSVYSDRQNPGVQRSGSNGDLAGILTNAPTSYHHANPSIATSMKSGYRPSSLAYQDPAQEADDSALLSEELQDQHTSPVTIPTAQKKNPKKHNITISTSMPFVNQPKGRESTSIMSPDDLLKAYASNKVTSPAPTLPHQNSQQSSFFDLTGPRDAGEGTTTDEDAPGAAQKKAKAGGKKFGFGFGR